MASGFRRTVYAAIFASPGGFPGTQDAAALRPPHGGSGGSGGALRNEAISRQDGTSAAAARSPRIAARPAKRPASIVPRRVGAFIARIFE